MLFLAVSFLKEGLYGVSSHLHFTIRFYFNIIGHKSLNFFKLKKIVYPPKKQWHNNLARYSLEIAARRKNDTFIRFR